MDDLEKGIVAFNNKEYKIALDTLLPLAESGDGRAEYIIGSMCEMGLGIPQHYVNARGWYERACKNRDAMAESKMGEIYYHGLLGRSKNPVLARDYFRSAAEKGIPAAQYNLAGMYERGEAVAASPADAHIWYNLAASHGYEDAAIARDRIAQNMGPREIREAQNSALQIFRSTFKS